MKARSLAALACALTFALIFCIINGSEGDPSARPAFSAAIRNVPVILDPGHGGLDGGAVADDGTAEAPLNLVICLRTRDLFTFLGVRAVMTREDEQSLDFDPNATIRQNKRADLEARLRLAQSLPDSAFISVHLNKYQQERYSGAQVFYSPNNARSQTLAFCLQTRLCALDDTNERRARLTPDGVFLMQRVTAPAVTAELGFLSNRREAGLLREPAYQRKLAMALCCGYIDFTEMGDP